MLKQNKLKRVNSTTTYIDSYNNLTNLCDTTSSEDDYHLNDLYSNQRHVS